MLDLVCSLEAANEKCPCLNSPMKIQRNNVTYVQLEARPQSGGCPSGGAVFLSARRVLPQTHPHVSSHRPRGRGQPVAPISLVLLDHNYISVAALLSHSDVNLTCSSCFVRWMALVSSLWRSSSASRRVFSSSWKAG